MAKRTNRKLPRGFYNRPTLEVAEAMIGKHIVYASPWGRMAARIVEVEAYIGRDDPACHAARGLTPRNEVMFGEPGHSYVYFIYGMYHCLNFVTEQKGFPAAVLLRAAEPETGTEIMQRFSPGKKVTGLLSGPGKFCRSFGLSREQNGIDLTGDLLFLEDHGRTGVEVARSPRIGVKEGSELPWRFFDAGSQAVSRQAPTRR